MGMLDVSVLSISCVGKNIPTYEVENNGRIWMLCKKSVNVCYESLGNVALGITYVDGEYVRELTDVRTGDVYYRDVITREDGVLVLKCMCDGRIHKDHLIYDGQSVTISHADMNSSTCVLLKTGVVSDSQEDHAPRFIYVDDNSEYGGWLTVQDKRIETTEDWVTLLDVTFVWYSFVRYGYDPKNVCRCKKTEQKIVAKEMYSCVALGNVDEIHVTDSILRDMVGIVIDRVEGHTYWVVVKDSAALESLRLLERSGVLSVVKD